MNGELIARSSGGTDGSNVGATREPGEPNHANIAGSSSVWYRWTPPATGQAELSIFANTFSATIAVYTGSAVSALIFVASNDGSDGVAHVGFAATAGTEYRIAVDGYPGAAGPFSLDWITSVPPPVNDAFANGTVISGRDGMLSTSGLGATKEAGEPNHAGEIVNASIWFRWSPPTTGMATINTVGSDFDSVLAVYTGSSVAGLTQVAANNDYSPVSGASAVSFSATAGTEYRIAVDVYTGVADIVVLNWGQPPGPPTITVSSPNGGETVVAGTPTAVTWTYTQSIAPSSAVPLAPSSAAPQQPLRTASDMELDKVAAVARAKGKVRAIVSLDVGFRPEGALSSPQATDQRTRIRGAQDQVLRHLKGTDHRLARTFETFPSVVLELNANAVERLRSAPGITGIVEDGLAAPDLAESAPLVEAPQAWAAGFNGADKMIAVLDTGVDRNHPFLNGRVIEEACYSVESDCPNGSTSQTGPGSGAPCIYSSDCDHGTHVAGIAAGSGTSSSGVGKGAPIMAVQVFHRVTGSFCGVAPVCVRSNTSDLMAGLERVYLLRNTHAFAAVNMSLGGGQFFSNCDNEAEKPAIDNLRSVGIATVVSSGNDGYTGSMSSPACISTAVSVGSTTKTDSVSTFSNSASFLSLLAPGSNIVSSVPGGGFGTKSGTSMAAPHVAGAWAVLKQHQPGAGVDAVLAALQSTGQPVNDARAGGFVKPRIRVYPALLALTPRVDIHLLKAGSQVATIAQGIPASAGSFSWTPTGVQPGSDYRVRVSVANAPGTTDTSNADFTIGAAPRRQVADFDGNGTTDRSVYRSGAWYVAGQPAVFHGQAGDIPVPADYDGNGTTDRAVFRNGAWFVEGLPTVFFGLSGDVPVPGDYDGDGDADRAVFRPSVGAWYVEGQATVYFGSPGDIPVPGDYDGNGTTDRAVFRNGAWYVQGQATVFFGLAGDIPVPGDYDGNGTTDRAVFRNGAWYVQNQSTVYFGLSGDIPEPGDYDGSGTTDRAVFRSGAWYVQGQPTVFFGLTGDVPLPLPQAIYRRFF